ncbi:metallophosphoesterase family protein [Luteibaculum oceani]|uniref:Metallophosphoesterase family protein n=1 Tax=Luteibaculum oceani TaxID=1294296 RepID=A0A5C6VFH0_9FLAO|nr:metallophosphoesterase family protein [Luteibaculum oceani]TXC82078.1 metallophosphoesterase family protein [Luteibaculum oceani]
MEKIKSIKIPGNRLLVFGGVYSNLEALNALQEFAAFNGFSPNEIICTGDIVGYCANPKESLETVAKWGIHSIAGNVELQLKNNEDDCGCDFDENSRCDVFSKQWYPFAKERIGENELEFIGQLPEFLKFEFGGINYAVVHGSYFNTSEFIFKSTPWTAKARNFEALEADCILSGHGGIPFYDFNDNKAWINAGVIGMPANDGTTKTWCCVLETTYKDLSVQFHQLKYDNVLAAEKMRKEKLPEAYAKTLETGIWDNCDILPPAETELQGKKLAFNPEIHEKV